MEHTHITRDIKTTLGECPACDRGRYDNWLAIHEGMTPSIEEYRYWYAYDDNLPWRFDGSQVLNLLDNALERIDLLTEENSLLIRHAKATADSRLNGGVIFVEGETDGRG